MAVRLLLALGVMDAVQAGVTITQPSARSSRGGMRMAACSNRLAAFRMISKATTPSGGAPSAMAPAILIHMESQISMG